jgi:hypothetical protein
MGIMHHGQIVGMASLGTEPCVRACPGFSVGQASRATGEILGPSDATQAGGWHSHLGRRVLSQVPAPLQFEPFSHVGVVSKYLRTAIPKWRSRQLVGTISSRGAVSDADCHVCGRQLVCTAQCGTEGRSYYIGLGACTYFCIESRCGLLLDCSAQGSLQFAVVVEACSVCIEPQRGLLPPGLCSPGNTSIGCGGS